MQTQDISTTELFITIVIAMVVIFTSSYAVVLLSLMPPIILGLFLCQLTAILIRRHQKRGD